MPNRRELRKQQQIMSANQPSNIDRLRNQLQTLVEKKNYRQAIEKVKQIRKMHPDVEIKPSQADIWTSQGHQEYSQGQHQQAQISLRKAIELGCAEEVYYWLSKSLLATGNSDEALDTMRNAFENKALSKIYTGCYLKLLFQQGATDEVTTLLKNQSKQFSASQIHWANGVLLLQVGKLEEALGHFKKMSGNATPGDSPNVWIIHTQQQLGNWDRTESQLATPTHPAMQRLALVQTISQRAPSTAIALDQYQGKQRTLRLVVLLIQLLDESKYHDAAHILQQFSHPCQFPAIDALHRPVMILAASQAMKAKAAVCSASFLEAIVYQPPFDSQLALKLHCIYQEDRRSIHEVKRLLDHLLAGVKREAQQHPQNWSEAQLNSTLAKIYCWLTDAWMTRGEHHRGYKTLQIAIQLCPDSPEVIGRQGLAAYIKGKVEEAIPLMIKALEGGCSYEQVYDILLSELEDRDDLDVAKDIMRRFGKLFGDLPLDNEVEIPKWIEALSTQDYEIFEALVEDQKNPDAALKACQIFVATVEGEPSSSGRVGFNQELANKHWELLLQGVSAPEQILILQAIFLLVQLFAKRQKGIVAIQNQCLQRLLAMVGEYPEAQLAYLMLWVVKGDRPAPMQMAIRSYLHTAPQPGTALAQLQLHAHRYVQTVALRPLIDEFLRRDTQNPQLLLAQATTYQIKSKEYEALKEQGFDLARRLQDASALQAYREEEIFQSAKTAAELFPAFMETDDFDLMDMAKNIARKALGDDVSPEVLAKMLPKLMQMLEADLPDFDDEEDDDFDPRPLFGGLPMQPPRKTPKGRTAQKRRK
jgi:tetratricopeptide (TPR) repeat protein